MNNGLKSTVQVVLSEIQTARLFLIPSETKASKWYYDIFETAN